MANGRKRPELFLYRFSGEYFTDQGFRKKRKSCRYYGYVKKDPPRKVLFTAVAQS